MKTLDELFNELREKCAKNVYATGQEVKEGDMFCKVKHSHVSPLTLHCISKITNESVFAYNLIGSKEFELDEDIVYLRTTDGFKITNSILLRRKKEWVEAHKTICEALTKRLDADTGIINPKLLSIWTQKQKVQ